MLFVGRRLAEFVKGVGWRASCEGCRLESRDVHGVPVSDGRQDAAGVPCSGVMTAADDRAEGLRGLGECAGVLVREETRDEEGVVTSDVSGVVSTAAGFALLQHSFLGSQ